jgi:hypothetical protein
MAVIDSLTAAKANIAATLAGITANPKPTYSIDGQQVSWTEYHTMLVAQMKLLNDLLQVEGGPFEYVTQAIP